MPLGTSELLKVLHIRDRNYLREGYIRPTLRAGFIEQTRPNVKHSSFRVAGPFGGAGPFGVAGLCARKSQAGLRAHATSPRRKL